ncbi:MAG TPA: hypothetical protein VM049_07440 [Gaiellaceae bacterium]|nr:hypothetical protein [Gaiellaceae bacterium]
MGSSDPSRQSELRLTSYDADDFERAVAVVSVESSPRVLVERLGLDWEYLEWIAVDAAATVLGEHEEARGVVVSYGGEAFTAGFLIGIHVREEPTLEADLVAVAVDAVQERGRHAVIADHCDLASVARLETVYSDALVESMAVAEVDREALRSPVTRIFEAGLAVGLELGSGSERQLDSREP